MIRLLDGSSGGGSVATLLELGATYVPFLPGFSDAIPALRQIPVVSAVLGPVVGLGAARAQISHFSVIVKKIGQLFVAGPPLVEYATHEKLSKEELGGWQICASNGSIDNAVDTEQQAFESVRKFLSFLPQNIFHLPPKTDARAPLKSDEERLLDIVPRARSSTYDVRCILNSIVDLNSFFEIGENWGKSSVVGLARMNGFSVGIIASDPTHLGGSLNSATCEKIIRHVKLCEQFHIPILNFVDCPGFFIGKVAEQEATIRKGADLLGVFYETSLPMFTFIVRKCFGVGGAALVYSDMKVAWPSGDWGSLPLEGGIEAGFQRQLKNAPNAEALKADLTKKLEAVRAPIRTAEKFGIPEIIDPRTTRQRACDWVETIYQNVLPQMLLSRNAKL
eukprot:TRINITY_DN2733_c1_g1_i1.p1 TRINITY_DN2733_c1_g1~~TRINITY_DN2733_c1_g1_i1.p1  ORF type:complete len:392 (+),score=68.38 TRINITY_DN2733_c1_g1_i1:83-1258(+)